MIGRTEEEVAALTENLYAQLSRPPQDPTPQPPSYEPSPPVPQNGALPTPPDPSLSYSDPQRYQRELLAYQQALTQQAIQQTMSQYAAPLLANNAETAKELSRQGEFANIWKRWAPEIELRVQSIPQHLRTKALYDDAARLVRSDHFEELARERAESMYAGGGAATERANGPSAAPSASLDKLDEVYDSEHPFFVNARAQRVTKEMIRDVCRKTGITVDDYVRNATLGTVIVSSNGYERRTA